MGNLAVLQYKEKRVLTTKQLAECYKTSENRIQNNFSENKERYEESVHYFKLMGESLRFFKIQLGNSDLVHKKASTIYLWTEKGALLHAKSLNTQKAWEVYKYLVNTYYRVKEESGKWLSVEAMRLMNKQLFMLISAVEQTNEKIMDLDHKVENQITLDYGKQTRMQFAIKERVVRLLGGKETEEYRLLSKRYFISIHRDIKKRLGVPSYKDIKVKDYERAVNYIKNWLPEADIKVKF